MNNRLTHFLHTIDTPPLQVLDARDPAGCRCPDVERYVRSLDPNKRVILLLNKMGECRRGGGSGCVLGRGCTASAPVSSAQLSSAPVSSAQLSSALVSSAQ
jgi:hypothetical protein